MHSRFYVNLIIHHRFPQIVKILLLLALAAFLPAVALAQQPGLATFQETAQIIVDRTVSQDVTASVTLQSTSIQEITVPAQLEQRIREDPWVSAIVVTNEDTCVLGVVDEACVIIKVDRNPEHRGITEIQDTTREIANRYIDEVNAAFGTDAEFHSVFVHSEDTSNRVLDTSGVISGKGTISAVYTMPMEDSRSMYEGISAILIPDSIRDAGGFHDVARDMSRDDNAKVTFSMIPMDSGSLMQLKAAVTYPGGAADVARLSPMEFLQTDVLERSGYLDGFYPLNSLVQVVVLSPEDARVSDVGGQIIPSRIVEGQRIPTDISSPGWIFEPEEGQRIQGKYIFGDSDSVEGSDLEFALGDAGAGTEPEPAGPGESLIVVAVIAAAAGAAALFYLRGYGRRSE